MGKNRLAFFWGAAVVLAVLFGFGCEAGDGSGGTELKIASWNVQNFFDAVNDGSEYGEFRKSGKWGEEAYRRRLSRLCDGLRRLDAEVYVLEEIENERVVQDIANMMAGEGAWQRKKRLAHAVFAKDGQSAIGIAVLSRLPIENVSVHSLDIRTEKGRQPHLRPVVELRVQKAGRTLAVLANHWKSKAGGAAESEPWRLWQESVLAERVLNLAGLAAVACGDFNKDIAEFLLTAGEPKADTGQFCGREEETEFWGRGENSWQVPNMILRHKNFGGFESVGVFSPWLCAGESSAETGAEGSYYFRESWEKIDHFFASGGAVLHGFAAATGSPFATENGLPDRYAVHTGQGMSDHLPLVCTVRF